VEEESKKPPSTPLFDVTSTVAPQGKMKASRPPHPSSLTGDRFRGFHINEVSNWKKTHVMGVTLPMEIPELMPIKHTNYRAQVAVKAHIPLLSAPSHDRHMAQQQSKEPRRGGILPRCLISHVTLWPPLSRRTGCLSIPHTHRQLSQNKHQRRCGPPLPRPRDVTTSGNLTLDLLRAPPPPPFPLSLYQAKHDHAGLSHRRCFRPMHLHTDRSAGVVGIRRCILLLGTSSSAAKAIHMLAHAHTET
jgi:hypothetical protein